MIMPRSNEFFTQDSKDDPKQDAELHEAILDNPEADRMLSEAAIRRAVNAGMPLEKAQRLYGLKR